MIYISILFILFLLFKQTIYLTKFNFHLLFIIIYNLLYKYNLSIIKSNQIHYSFK
jgi:hypothetical protein